MADHDKVEKIGKISSSDSSKQLTAIEHFEPNKEHFDSLMTSQSSSPKIAEVEPVPVETSNKNSLMDEVRDLHFKEGSTVASAEHLTAQTREIIAQIDTAKEKLSDPNLNLRQSSEQLLNNKLTHIDDNLKVALSKAGIEYQPHVDTTLPKYSAEGRVNPIERFLGFLTDGQYKLENLGNELSTMAANNREMSPAQMIVVQIKVGQIQQEIELFTSLLSKSLDSIKTIMNIQV